jgi:putative FmdB family regulatory protein
MPLYEYRCAACDKTFEIIASLAERDEKAVCPACGGHDPARVYSPIALGGRRTSINPENFVRPHGPEAPPRLSPPNKGAKS